MSEGWLRNNYGAYNCFEEGGKESGVWKSVVAEVGMMGVDGGQA